MIKTGLRSTRKIYTSYVQNYSHPQIINNSDESSSDSEDDTNDNEDSRSCPVTTTEITVENLINNKRTILYFLVTSSKS